MSSPAQASEQGGSRAFIVCEPIYGRNGYHLSITRQRADAEPGTTELLTTETFGRLAAEGCTVASLGVAPLAKLDDPDLARHPRLARLMRFTYERTEGADDFKSIFRDKAQYRPHAWEPHYLCFRPRMSPRMLRATWQVRAATTTGEMLRAAVGRAVGEHSRFKEMSLKQKFQVTSASCRHAASFVAGCCAAVLLL
ncbi:MAG: phosphatidylglycerol lysyltransferase domain-containing protein [Pyrinomonadaceae bacterium]